MCLKILYLSARHRKSSGMLPGQVLPIEPYPYFSFSVKAINRTQKITLNSVAHMHSSYEMLQGHGCMPFQDPSCKFISVLERICCSIKTGSQQFDLYRKCSALHSSEVFVQYSLSRMLANLRDVKIPQPYFEKWRKIEEWSNYLYGEKKKKAMNKPKAGRWLSQATISMIIFLVLS